MKFLRLAFYVLIAQLVLSSCAGEAVEETSSSEINFDAYVGRDASTRTSETNIDFLKGNAYNAGFGVFAIYRHTDKTIPPLMLMNNEHVYWKNWKGDRSDWGYENTRYWPNEGSVDFYAFAPRSADPQLVNKPGGKEPNPTYIYFPSNWSPVDLVWANAKDRTKTNERVKFTFNHALARLSFDVTANQDLEENGAVIKVKEVRLYGADENKGIFIMAGYLNLENGAWTPEDNGTRWFYTWTPEGKKDDKPDAKKDSVVYQLSASQLDHTTPKITNDDDSYIFIIPQPRPQNFNLKITYTVEQGNFKEDVTVKKSLLEFFPDRDPFVKGGKAYVFHLKLSLDPINFNVTTKVEDWKEGKNE
jgi:hypothetical protein